jgi:hypothetical protein
MLFAQESVAPVVRNFDPIPLIAILVPAAFLAFVIAIIVSVQPISDSVARNSTPSDL